MTTKRTSKPNGEVKSGQNSGASWRGFVNVELSAEDRSEALRLTENVIDFWDALDDCLRGGYRLTVTFTAGTDVYNATLTGVGEVHPDQGIAVSARASTPDKAVAAVVVKLVHGAKGSLARLFDGGAFYKTDL